MVCGTRGLDCSRYCGLGSSPRLRSVCSHAADHILCDDCFEDDDAGCPVQHCPGSLVRPPVCNDRFRCSRCGAGERSFSGVLCGACGCNHCTDCFCSESECGCGRGGRRKSRYAHIASVAAITKCSDAFGDGVFPCPDCGISVVKTDACNEMLHCRTRFCNHCGASAHAWEAHGLPASHWDKCPRWETRSREERVRAFEARYNGVDFSGLD
jgi:hypothetical protein